MSEDGHREGAQAGAPPPRPDCLCMGIGPELTRLVRHLGPGDETWQQLRAVSLEGLKVLRALIDQQIEAMSREPQRGTRVKIE